MISARNITKRYGAVLALNNVSFEIEAGDAVALWGANGAGKTTMLRCLLGVQTFEGTLTVGGHDVRRSGKTARSLIGYVPQEARFYDLPVLDTLHFYARLKNVIPDRVRAILTEVQLEDHQHKHVSMLSGGMKQRLALAVALLADPPILMLDEPTANLDVQAQRDFVLVVQKLSRAGKTIIFSSHRLDEVIALARRTIVLNQGEIMLACQPHELPEKLGIRRWLHVWVSEDMSQPALEALRRAGYVCSAYGDRISLQLNGHGKMAPLRALQQVNVPIQDFDLAHDDLLNTEENLHG